MSDFPIGGDRDRRPRLAFGTSGHRGPAGAPTPGKAPQVPGGVEGSPPSVQPEGYLGSVHQTNLAYLHDLTALLEDVRAVKPVLDGQLIRAAPRLALPSSADAVYRAFLVELCAKLREKASTKQLMAIVRPALSQLPFSLPLEDAFGSELVKTAVAAWKTEAKTRRGTLLVPSEHLVQLAETQPLPEFRGSVRREVVVRAVEREAHQGMVDIGEHALAHSMEFAVGRPIALGILELGEAEGRALAVSAGEQTLRGHEMPQDDANYLAIAFAERLLAAGKTALAFHDLIAKRMAAQRD